MCSLCHSTRAFGRVWNKFVRGAKARGNPREVHITKEEFRALVESHCHYCGDPPDGRIHRFLGVDRVDNSKDYELGNCVPCCWPCNKAKGTMAHDEFLALCRKIAAFNSV